jgi:hypothetical protein
VFTKSQRAYAGSEDGILPACNPLGFELTLGWGRVDDERNAVVQGKFLLKEMKTGGTGFAASAGAIGSDKFANGIASFSFFEDRSVVHGNLGVQHSDATRGTWGIGLEQLLVAPRWYGMVEAYGQRGQKPTLQTGLRFSVIPDRIQIDSTVGRQRSSPEQRFFTVGMRVLY